MKLQLKRPGGGVLLAAANNTITKAKFEYFFIPVPVIKPVFDSSKQQTGNSQLNNTTGYETGGAGMF